MMNIDMITKLMKNKEMFLLNKSYYEQVNLYGKENELFELSLGLEIAKKRAAWRMNEQLAEVNEDISMQLTDEMYDYMHDILHSIAKDLAKTIFIKHNVIIPYSNMQFYFNLEELHGSANFKSFNRHDNKHMNFFCWYMSCIVESMVMMIINGELAVWVKEHYKYYL